MSVRAVLRPSLSLPMVLADFTTDVQRTRLALLRAVRSGRPGSIYELSRMVNRDLKNVQDDLRILETYGLVRMADATRKGKRRVRVPRSLVDQIELKIAI